MPALHAIAGPLKGAIFRITIDDITIGRLGSNQLCVGDPSVSRQHCVIEVRGDSFQIRDLSSNNGTFVNGNQIEQSALADGDRIRIGDTVFRWVMKEETNEQLTLPDNGVVAITALEHRASTPTAMDARVLLRIGAALNTCREPEALQIELLKQILEVTPAEQAAIVLLPQSGGSAPSIVGWDRRRREAGSIPVSRTLVAKAIRERLATFSDDVTSNEELNEVSSLTRRSVASVIAVPLSAEERTIGAIYLDSANPEDRLHREHLEIAAAIGEFAGPSLEHAVRLSALKEENRRLHSALQLDHNMIGCSAAMRIVTERIARIAGTDATALIRGETGTGKELAARAIHQNSARAGRPFEAINCSLLRDALLESELFGHERGSFTGAVAQKKGKLELAGGGTVFLDELAELGETQQAMLLRVLQTREFQRLGGTRSIPVDLRIIAATNKNLEESIQNKTFREDLYYRLNVVSVTMPALRERREDIPLLADHFVRLYSRKNKRLVTGVSREAAALLVQYDWPGNVRELENAIEYAVVFGSADEILPDDLPEIVIGSAISSDRGYHHAVREAKRKIVCSAVAKASGNYGEAARLLGIHVNNLHRLIRELELKPRLVV